MRLNLVISRNNLRVTWRRRTTVARPGRRTSGTGGTLFLRLVLGVVLVLRYRSRGTRGAVVHVALRLGRLGMGALVRLVTLGLRLAVAAAVMHEDVDAAVFGVLRKVLVVIVVGRLGIFGDDVPGVKESRDLVGLRVSERALAGSEEMGAT